MCRVGLCKRSQILLNNLLQYYSKTEYKFCQQTSFHNVNTNNTSSGLWENGIPTNFGTNYHWKIWHKSGCWGGEAPLGGPYLPRSCACVPLLGAPCGTVMGIW